MTQIVLKVKSLKHIGTIEYAKILLEILDKYNMLPDKIGTYEPLRKAYSAEEAIKMWLDAGGDSPNFRMGTLIGKKKNPNIAVDVMWNIGEIARVNYIDIWFTKKSFKQCRESIEKLFQDLIKSTEAFWGYISYYNIVARQHVTGTIETRMDGIFWCNYFSRVYVNFFAKAIILSAPWYKTELLDNDGIIAYLSKEPDDEAITGSLELADKMKEYLGKDSFGDVEEWKASNIFETQYKNVPELDFSEIRRPLSDFGIKA